MHLALRDEYDRTLEEHVYYQLLGDPYMHPSAARQVRESLVRSRRAGLDFDFAWKVALRRLMHEHEGSQRRIDLELLQDPELIEAWRRAYYREPHAALDAVRTLTAMLESAEAANARHRHPEAA